MISLQVLNIFQFYDEYNERDKYNEFVTIFLLYKRVIICCQTQRINILPIENEMSNSFKPSFTFTFSSLLYLFCYFALLLSYEWTFSFLNGFLQINKIIVARTSHILYTTMDFTTRGLLDNYTERRISQTFQLITSNWKKKNLIISIFVNFDRYFRV